MKSFVRDSFIPAAARPYLRGRVRGRKSATPFKSQQKPQDQSSGLFARPAYEMVATGQAVDDVDGQDSLHTADTILNRAPKSATDSGYASDLNAQTDLKENKMRHMYKRITAKCRNIWRKAPNLTLVEHYQENNLNNNADHDSDKKYALCGNDSGIVENNSVPDSTAMVGSGAIFYDSRAIKDSNTDEDTSTIEDSSTIGDSSKPAAGHRPQKIPDILADGYDAPVVPPQVILEVPTDFNSAIPERQPQGSVSNDSGLGEDYEGSDTDSEDYVVQGPRCDFKAINVTPDELFEALARSVCNNGQAIGEVCVERRTQGTYNFAAIITVSRAVEIERYVVRIPGHATLSHWTPEDAYMMEREVQLIEYIRNKTSAPVAKIVQHSTKHTNMLGFPYIFMTALPGKPASTIWYDGIYEDDDFEFELAFQHADIPSVGTEKKRITFLRSLARVMTEIQSLTFDMTGMPIFSEDGDITIGPVYRWNEATCSDTARKDNAAVSTQVYGLSGLTRQYVKLADLNDAATLKHHGALKCFSLLFGQSFFKPTQPETFTIHHTDLDLQNIFVDDEGNVTGIIDWDNAFAAPRCIGTAAAPLFLQKDWLPDYINNLGTGPHMGWKTHSYREIYAAALLEAGNSDVIYTINSAIYRAAFTAAWEFDDSMYDFVDKMLREIPHCRVKADDFMSSLGHGWQDAENMLKAEFAKILEPQLPRPNLLADLDADIALKEWYSTFDDYLVEDEEDKLSDSDSQYDNDEMAYDSDNE
jgi:aminoglycoside phosphotransferase (APT) family kinase protein